MKKVLFSLFAILLLTSVSRIKKNDNAIHKCSMLKLFLKDENFYNGYSLNLNFADSISIIDKSNFFKRCKRLRLKNQNVIITHDSLFRSKLYYLKEEKEKYRYTFVIDSVSYNKNVAKVYFLKLVNNYSGFFEYKIKKGKLFKSKEAIGQY